MKRCLIIVNFLLLSAVAAGETNYAFRARMAELHPRRLIENAKPPAADEMSVDKTWSIVVEDADENGVMNHAADDLRDYFNKSMNVRLGKGTRNSIVLAVDSALEPLQSKVSAVERDGAKTIRITGVDAREVYQGCCRLEDLMNRRGMPAVKKGEKTFTRMFSPRMTHSGWEIEKYPDEYMDQIVHAGMDSIIVYIEKSPDITRNGRADIPELVERAKKRGLDVYAYANFPVEAAKFHPLDAGAREYYDKIYGGIVKNAPGLKGLICVGESVAFKSRHPGTVSFWWADAKTRKEGMPVNGFYPSPDWKEWLELVSDVTRAYNKDFEIIFWTYNWSRSPVEKRLALLESIPVGVTVNVTFELGSPVRYHDGVEMQAQDYSITESGPSEVFVSEAEVCRRRGIKLCSMANSAGRTWDFGALPFEPLPHAWLRRFRNVRSAREKWGLAGLMESHHYGFIPNFIAEIAKCVYTRETDENAVYDKLEEIASREFSKECAKTVISGWSDWSEAFRWHSALWFDQYGPLRTGSSYPFTLPGVVMPDPPNPQYEYYDGVKHGTGWKYLSKFYQCNADQLPGRILTDETEIALLESGNRKLESALRFVPEEKRERALRVIGYGKYMLATVRTLRNARRYRLEGLKGENASRATLTGILQEEADNVRELMPWVERDSSLGFEPAMRYVTDVKMLKWKLKQLENEKKNLERKELK